MTAEGIATLVNLGVGGAVIAVVIIFLKFIEKRDNDWRNFFQGLRKEDNEHTSRLAIAIERMLNKFEEHDATEMEILRELLVERKQRRRGDPNNGESAG